MYFTFIFVAVILGVAALAMLWRILVELFVRTVLGVLFALFLGLAGGLVATDFGFDGFFVGTLLMVFIMIPCFKFVSRWRTARRPKKMQSASVVASQSRKPRPGIEERVGIENAQELRDAWTNASLIAPDVDLDASREACARFLKVVSSTHITDAGMIELAVLIRKHVPGLTRDTEEVLRFADDAEAKVAIQQMLEGLKALGDEATNALDGIKKIAQERLVVRCFRLSQARADGLVF